MSSCQTAASASLLLLLLHLLAHPEPTVALDNSQCIAPLGMESGAIPDHDLTASSSFDRENVGPEHGRVRTENHGGAWCPKHQITAQPDEWLQVQLHQIHVITAVETQGRFGNGVGQEFAEAYMLEYWRPRLEKWVRYRDLRGEENVEEMLNACIKGKLVIGFFKEHGRLDETRRNIVSDILVSEYLQSTAYTKELWVGGDQPRETSAGRGKLLTRLYNLRRSMAAYKLIPGPSKKSKNVLNEAEDPDEESESEPNDGDLEWLKGNKEPWTKCTDLWKKTSKKRIRTLTSGKQSVMEYMESYPGLKDKSGYLLVLKGNTNTYLEAKNELNPPIRASSVRFLPYSYHRRTVCMRVELYGCPWTEGVVSYSMPQGDKRKTLELFDSAYDGHWDGEYLRRGLGLLTDGRVGSDNLKTHHEQNLGWVGWKNESRSQPIEIKFEFDKVREFKAVHIYCNNQFTKDIQVFSEAQILFSVGGQIFSGQPISYTPLEDRIFEHSRNVSIKLHHRVGMVVKLRLFFASKWILISEVAFDSVVAHGNFSVEAGNATEPPTQSDVDVERHQHKQSKTPVASAEDDDPTYMAIIIGVLMAVILLLAAAIFLIVSRHRKRKCFASPLASKAGLPHTLPPIEKGTAVVSVGHGSAGASIAGSYGLSLDGYGRHSTLPPPPPPPPGGSGDMAHLLEGKLDDYQEPYQGLKYAPYYSYSTVVMDAGDAISKSATTPSDTTYDYAVPESGGGIPLLSPEAALPLAPGVGTNSDKGSLFSKSSSSRSDDAKSRTSPAHGPSEALRSLKRRLQTAVPEFPRHRLRMLARLGEGAFGTLYVAEADGIPEYGTKATVGKRLVAVKFLNQGAGEKEKLDFHRDVRLLSALQDPHLARVLGLCSQGEPLCVALEYLPHGDLHRYLSTQVADQYADPTACQNFVSFNTLLYMAAQIASGMRYLESLNFVHRDLACRNCLVGDNYEIKISDFGTDNELYAADYYSFGENVSLPVRWMAWESVFLGKYTTKSDVWSFAVTLWEMMHLCRTTPFAQLTDAEVVENLTHLHPDDGQFEPLAPPPLPVNARDVYDLMCECWRRAETERPTFREIHLFLQRKNLGYSPGT